MSQQVEERSDVQRALDEAAEIAGSYSELARRLGGASNKPNMWWARGVVPGEEGPNVERATDGRIAAERLCPDARYVRMPDPSWPNPAGRPLLDTARKVA